MTAEGETRRAIDWGDVHRRLAEAARALDDQFVPSPAQRRAVLEARARALAVLPPPDPGPSLDVLDFVVGDQRYAIESTWVREVVPLRGLTPLPGTPPFVLGIVPLRGEPLSVLDLRRFFGLPDRSVADLDKIVVLADATMCFGIVAERILGVRSLAVADVQPPLPTHEALRPEYLLGVTCERDLVLEAGRLLSDPSIVVDDDAPDDLSGKNPEG